jgi:TolB-like protein
MHYKGPTNPCSRLPGIEVDAVLKERCSVGRPVHVKLTLIRGLSELALWAAGTDRDLRDALDLQSEVAQA